jgi:hypothetical protein
MASFIFSNSDENTSRSISELLDKTAKSRIDEILVCDDNGTIKSPSGSILTKTNKIGRANLWNAAAEIAKGSELVFIDRLTKFSKNWFEPLLSEVKNDNKIASPVVHTLDTNLWMSESNCWARFGWRWDLELYSRARTQSKESPAISSYCMAISKEWFNELGQFDAGMGRGYGEDIELSLRSWLFGGSCVVRDDSTIASSIRLDNTDTTKNLSRIIETWIPNHSTDFKLARGIGEIDCGRIDNLLKLQNKQRRSIDWFLKSLQPDLLGVYKLRNSGSGKSVAVVGPGSSIDMVNPSLINRHDIIIGVDYVGMLFNCDYVLTDAAHVIIELRKKYEDGKFVLPITIENGASGRYDSASSIAPGSIQFEFAHKGSDITKIDPPFCNLDNTILTAIHFALYLNPREITVYGCDNKIISGRSHSSRIDHYNEGKLWNDNDTTRKRFAASEHYLSKLAKLASDNGICLFRHNHA